MLSGIWELNMTTTTTTAAKGGSWLIEEADASAVFTREKLSE